jgi:hypothetical protein
MRTPTLLAVISLLAACGPTPMDMQAPDFQGGGQVKTTIADAPYPGPYGVGIGSVINNYSLFGFPNATNDTTTLKPITLGEFYNPTGTDKFGAGSAYGEGNPKPKVLLIDRAAVWCGPCNDEAKSVLPGMHAMFFPNAQFLLALDEGSTPGTNPTQNQLKNWATTYKLDYPASVDPQTTFSTIVGQDAYPGNIIIRTSDMRIIEWVAGEPMNNYWTDVQKVIDGTYVLPTGG